MQLEGREDEAMNGPYTRKGHPLQNIPGAVLLAMDGAIREIAVRHCTQAQLPLLRVMSPGCKSSIETVVFDKIVTEVYATLYTWERRDQYQNRIDFRWCRVGNMGKAEDGWHPMSHHMMAALMGGYDQSAMSLSKRRHKKRMRDAEVKSVWLNKSTENDLTG
jgi:hypothetical protein